MVIGHDLPPVPLAEQAALDMMNYILGAVHLKTRMMVETRYNYGYTNDASGFLEDHWYGPGSYTYRSYSRPEVTENIYQNLMGEFIRIRSEKVTGNELFVAIGGRHFPSPIPGRLRINTPFRTGATALRQSRSFGVVPAENSRCIRG